MTHPADVPPEILARLRPVCLGLPETFEEPAWAGVRWRIRTRTFAQVLTVDPEHQRAFARAAGARQPICALTFRSSGEEMAGLLATGHPFFPTNWGINLVGMVLDDNADWQADWEEIPELLTESYRLLAPKKLAAKV